MQFAFSKCDNKLCLKCSSFFSLKRKRKEKKKCSTFKINIVSTLSIVCIITTELADTINVLDKLLFYAIAQYILYANNVG